MNNSNLPGAKYGISKVNSTLRIAITSKAHLEEALSCLESADSSFNNGACVMNDENYDKGKISENAKNIRDLITDLEKYISDLNSILRNLKRL